MFSYNIKPEILDLAHSKKNLPTPELHYMENICFQPTIFLTNKNKHTHSWVKTHISYFICIVFVWVKV